MSIGRLLFRSFCRSRAFFAAVVALVFSLTAAVAQEPSPLGSWDIVLSGHQRGIARIAFYEDGTLEGVTILTSNDRTIVHTNRGFLLTNWYGGGLLQGSWIYERTNQISGYINLISQFSPGRTNTTTNGISFRGKAKARLNLLATGPQGKVSMRGIPLVANDIIDLGGGSSYLGSLRTRTAPYPTLEIFSLNTDDPNTYSVSGGGPGYTYTGTFLVSNQRYAAFFQNRGSGTNGALVSAYAGPFNVRKQRGTLIGTDGIRPVIKYRISPESP